MINIDRLKTFIKQNNLYLLLFVFVLLFYAAIAASEKETSKEETAGAQGQSELRKEPTADEIEALLRDRKDLLIILSLVSFLVIITFLLGSAIDIYLLNAKARGLITFRARAPALVNWNPWDVGKAAILFGFFSSVILIAESSLSRLWPVIRDYENLRMAVNTTIIDSLICVLVLYFVIKENKDSIARLGLTLENIVQNTAIAVSSYLAIIPVMVIILASTLFVCKILNYQPPPQPILEFFFNEKNGLLVIYMTVFAAVGGPVVEEIFFRGFMYGAFKKRLGIFFGALASASVFSVLHANVIGFLPILVLGMVLSYVYEITGSLLTPMLVHIMHNSAMLILVHIGREIQG